jgi:hypothetical protein
MKKDIIVKIFEEEIVVAVDFSIIEKVERIYQCSAELAAAMYLSDPIRVQRRLVSGVIALWLQGKTKLQPTTITEAVMTCSQKQLARYTGMIQAAILHSIRGDDGKPLINDEQFDLLVNGEDLPAAPSKAAPGKKPAASRAATSRKRTNSR